MRRSLPHNERTRRWATQLNRPDAAGRSTKVQMQPPMLIPMTAERREQAVRAVAALLVPQIRAERQAANRQPEATEKPEN